MPGPFEMMRSRNSSPDDGAALDRVRDWTRARFALTDDETVMVSEVACSVPGCPPIETHLVFWTGAGRHHFKIFKPLAAVAEDQVGIFPYYELAYALDCLTATGLRGQHEIL